MRTIVYAVQVCYYSDDPYETQSLHWLQSGAEAAVQKLIDDGDFEAYETKVERMTIK